MAQNKTFSQKLDIASENIIYLLSIDSRQSVSCIADTLKVPRRIVEHRLKKLYDQNYIKPLLVFNGIEEYKATVFLKLSKFNEENISSVKKLKHVVKVKETLGAYDISLLLIVSSTKELDLVLSKINHKFLGNIENIDVILHEEDSLGHKLFCHDFSIIRNVTLLHKAERKFSNAEKKILTVLYKDPLASYKKLIKLTGLGYIRIKNILDTFEKEHIVRFSVDPDYQRLGLEFHNVLVKINPARKEEFERNILKQPHVHWIKKGVGTWDYILSIVARDMPEFIDVTRDIRTENKESILNFSALIAKIHVDRKI